MTLQQQFDHWCKAFGYDPSRDSRGAFYNHTARLLWEAWLAGWDRGVEHEQCNYLTRTPNAEL